MITGMPLSPVRGDILLDGDDLDLLCSGLTVAECLVLFVGLSGGGSLGVSSQVGL